MRIFGKSDAKRAAAKVRQGAKRLAEASSKHVVAGVISSASYPHRSWKSGRPRPTHSVVEAARMHEYGAGPVPFRLSSDNDDIKIHERSFLRLTFGLLDTGMREGEARAVVAQDEARREKALLSGSRSGGKFDEGWAEKVANAYKTITNSENGRVTASFLDSAWAAFKDGGRSDVQTLQKIGAWAFGRINEAFDTKGFGVWPDNLRADYVEEKGHATPLKETGLLQSSITYQVRG